MNLLDIKNPQFLKTMSLDELEALAEDIRHFLIENVARTGGHFSSNLGVVELTIALHYVFDSPVDKIIFDVGHQSYTHKILTGRADKFQTLRQYDGISGFQRRHESEHDIWEAGHSSTSLSAGIGLAVARDLDHQDFDVVCVIGDASIMNGESLEALNYLGGLSSKVIIILNDNDMSIAHNVGGLSNFLSDIRISHSYNQARSNYKQLFKRGTKSQKFYAATKRMKDAVKDSLMGDSLFNRFGLDYLGPIDGHNIGELITALQAVKDRDQSIVLHVQTKKGKGYEKAEKDTLGYYHGVAPFDVEKGIVRKTTLNKQTWSQCISHHLHYLMRQHQDICVITPAMIVGSGLNNIFKDFPKRSFDVGIEEEHAMTFTAGLSVGRKFPVLCIYSSFLQRAYDQLNHDIARMRLPCLIAVDRAGLVGDDGSTHHGIFDLSFMIPIPHLVIMAPHNQAEAEAMINTAYENHDGPYVIRYPKSIINKHAYHNNDTLEVGSWTKMVYDAQYTTTIIAYGDNVNVIAAFISDQELPVNLINARFIKPMDTKLLDEIADTHLIVYETDMQAGGLGSAIALYYSLQKRTVSLQSMGIKDHYVRHGKTDLLLRDEHLLMSDLRKVIEDIEDEKRTN